MDIVFDIETIPNRDMVSRLPAIEIKAGNLKDPAKIAEKEKAAKQDQIEKMALSPLYGRLCAFVAIDDRDNVIADCLEEETDEAESYLIEKVFRKILNGHRIITYNGTSFDIPFLYRRAVILGIDIREYEHVPTLAEMTTKYNKMRHVDLMQVWCGFGQFEKLDNIASAMFTEHKIEIDFRDFPELIKTPEGREKLLAYCKQDVRLTAKIWNRIAGILI